jgi:hypothetical protein
LVYSSSPLGSGFCADKRAKNSSTFSAFIVIF